MANATSMQETHGPVPFPIFAKLLLQRPHPNVLQVVLNDTAGNNRWNDVLFDEFIECFRIIALNNDIYCVLITANSKHFTVGLDLKWSAKSLTGTPKKSKLDVARKSFNTRKHLQYLQKSTNLIQSCPVPVIVAVQGGCFGMGIDLMSACDIRYCCANAFFSVKEVDIGVVADVGSLARLPKIIGNKSLLRELVYTGRRFTSDEALSFGLVNKVFNTENELKNGALELCKEIASKSPVTIRGIKEMFNYEMSGKSPQELQKFVEILNGALLQTNDIPQAAMSFFNKTKPKFAKL